MHVGADTSESFRCIDADCQSVTFSGSTLYPAPGHYQRAPSGESYHFDKVSTDTMSGSTHTIQRYASTVSYPDGEIITYVYDSGYLPGDTFNRTFYRPNRISSNTGYYITVCEVGR